MAKKKKRADSKRSQARRERDRRGRRSKSKGPPVIQHVSRKVPVAEKGYRIVGRGRAGVDYAKPFFDRMAKDDEESIDLAIDVARACWKMAVCDDEKEIKKLKKMVLEKIEGPDAEAFIDRMIERHHRMFPYIKEEPGFYIREKIIDAPVELKIFDESKVVLSPEIFPPAREDRVLLQYLRKLDKCIESGYDWEMYEKNFYSFQECIVSRYRDWCDKKGVLFHAAENFRFAVSSYLDFVYEEGNGTLFTIDEEAIREFVTLFWIRKTEAEPEQLSAMPKALELFYLFLKEKEFIVDIDRFVSAIKNSRPEFLANLKAYFTPSRNG